MNKELLIAFVSSIVDDAVTGHESNHESMRGRKGLKGRDGLDFSFSDNKEDISFLVNDYIESIKEDLKLKLTDEDRVNFQGKDGRDGKDGPGFIFDESKNEISSLIENHLKLIRGSLKLKFSDLSDKDLEELKGPRGQRGKPGNNLRFSECKDDLVECLYEIYKENKSELVGKDGSDGIDGIDGARGLRGQKGKDGSDGQDGKSGSDGKVGESGPRGLRGKDGPDGSDGQDGKDGSDGIDGIDGARGLRGQKGKDGSDGQDGKNFSFSDNKNEIEKIIEGLDLGLKFSNLSDHEKGELKGDRGKPGKPGKDFSFVENEEDVTKIVNEYIENISGDLKLKFSDLNDDEKYNLKLKFSDLLEDEKLELKGSRGQKGRRGEPGKDGLNGLRGIPGISGLNGKNGSNGIRGDKGSDAAEIVNVELKEVGESFRLVIHFSDGTFLETNLIEMPSIDKIINNYYSAIGGGSTGTGTSTIISKDGTELGPLEDLDFVGSNIDVVYNNGKAEVSVTEQDSCVGVYDEGVKITDCAKTFNFIGDDVEVLPTTVMSDWPTLDEIDSIGNWETADSGFINVKVQSPSKSAIRKIASEVIVKYDLVVLDTQTTCKVGAIDTYVNAAIVGVAINSANAGQEVEIVVFGVVEDASFNFPIMVPLFLNTDGSITSVAVSAVGEYLTKIGKSFGSGSIFIDVQDPRGIV